MDTLLVGGACRFCVVILSEIDQATGYAVLSYEDLAARIDLSEKQISNIANNVSAAGYLEYEPGIKGKTYSRFRMKMPEVSRVEDAVRQKKTSTMHTENVNVKAEQNSDLGRSIFPNARKKLPPLLITLGLKGP